MRQVLALYSGSQLGMVEEDMGKTQTSDLLGLVTFFGKISGMALVTKESSLFLPGTGKNRERQDPRATIWSIGALGDATPFKW